MPLVVKGREYHHDHEKYGKHVDSCREDEQVVANNDVGVCGGCDGVHEHGQVVGSAMLAQVE